LRQRRADRAVSAVGESPRGHLGPVFTTLPDWGGESLTNKKVITSRNACQLKSRYQRLRERGMLDARELAAQLKVSMKTIYNLGRDGLLKPHRYGSQRTLSAK
jgi:hypothetical protein